MKNAESTKLMMEALFPIKKMTKIRTTKAVYLRRIWWHRMMNPYSDAVMWRRKVRGVNKAFAQFV